MCVYYDFAWICIEGYEEHKWKEWRTIASGEGTRMARESGGGEGRENSLWEFELWECTTESKWNDLNVKNK